MEHGTRNRSCRANRISLLINLIFFSFSQSSFFMDCHLYIVPHISTTCTILQSLKSYVAVRKHYFSRRTSRSPIVVSQHSFGDDDGDCLVIRRIPPRPRIKQLQTSILTIIHCSPQPVLQTWRIYSYCSWLLFTSSLMSKGIFTVRSFPRCFVIRTACAG